MQLIITEKPSVARDLARAIGVRGGGQGCIEGSDRVVAWCLGHLVELEEPDAYDPSWKMWRLASLPMLPEPFKLRPVKSSLSQWNVVRSLLRDRRFTEVVNACDAGREGELIFRLCHELAGSKLPVRRLWISSLTDAAIREGFSKLEPSSKYDALGDAARSRSEADWLVGLNATRAVTVRARSAGSDALFSVGRVQTPTLTMLVARDRAIRAFVPKDYWEVTGEFAGAEGARFLARWSAEGQRRLAKEDLAKALVGRASAKVGAPEGPRVESVETKRQRVAPPMLFDLTSLQRTANGRFGYSAQRTLDLAQALYEKHKVLTYPRTDSRHLPRAMHATLPGVVRAVGEQGEYRGFSERLLGGALAKPARVFDDAKVSDHHAIIPTDHRGSLSALSGDERRLYDLVVRRFLGVFFPEAEFDQTVAVVVVGAVDEGERRATKKATKTGDEVEEGMLEALPPPPDRFTARGRVRVAAGWQEVAGFGDEEPSEKGGDESQLLPALKKGDALDGRYAPEKKQTQAPRRYNDATMLGAMESAGKQVDDEALREALKERGLGTPATRASMIETLIARGYAVREQKALVSTALGEALIGGLPVPALASAELTGAWEERLTRVAKGSERREDFMRDIRAMVGDLVKRVAGAPGIAMRGTAERSAAPVRGSSARGQSPTLPGAKRRSATGASPSAVRTDERKTPGAPRRVRSGSGGVGGEPPTKESRVLGSRTGVTCPVCSVGELIVGRRAWGCSRWKEGCTGVFAFEGGLPGATPPANKTRRPRNSAAPKTRRKKGDRPLTPSDG